MGEGFVIRDGRDRAVSSRAVVREDLLLDAFLELLGGTFAGLQEEVRLRITRITLEVDASLVKAASETDENRLASFGVVVAEIKHIVSDELSFCAISVCKREYNRVDQLLVVISRVVAITLGGGSSQAMEDLVTSDSAGSAE